MGVFAVLLTGLSMTGVVLADVVAELAVEGIAEDVSPGEQLEPNFFENFWQQDYLTGDWGGARPALKDDYGLAVEFFYTGEVLANVRGGIRHRAEYLDNFDLIVDLDAEKLLDWPGAVFYFYFLGNNGGNPSSRNIGDAQVASNIEANSTWKIYELWLEQNLLDNRLSVKAGLYDLNSEFDTIETASLFLNSSHGIGFDFAQSGRNGPSIFPVTSAAVRIRVEPAPHVYLQGAVLDGVPGDPGNPGRTQIVWKRSEGVLIAVEFGLAYCREKDAEEAYAKYAIGGWYYTAKFEDVLAADAAGDPVMRRGNSGFYALAEQTVFCEPDDRSQGLAVFARLGIADGKINQVFLYTGFGMAYTGLIPTRDQDQVGLAVAVIYNGDDFRRAMRNAGTPVDTSEVDIELTYLAQLTPWCSLQPDLQFIVNPGTDPNLKNSLVLGLRWAVSF